MNACVHVTFRVCHAESVVNVSGVNACVHLNVKAITSFRDVLGVNGAIITRLRGAHM